MIMNIIVNTKKLLLCLQFLIHRLYNAHNFTQERNVLQICMHRFIFVWICMLVIDVSGVILYFLPSHLVLATLFGASCYLQQEIRQSGFICLVENFQYAVDLLLCNAIYALHGSFTNSCLLVTCLVTYPRVLFYMLSERHIRDNFFFINAPVSGNPPRPPPTIVDPEEEEEEDDDDDNK